MTTCLKEILANRATDQIAMPSALLWRSSRLPLIDLRQRYISKVQMKAVFGMIPEHDQQAR
jgi:hypothetical protein